MGLRIQKQIGYFFDKKTASKLFIDSIQLEDLIEDLFSNPHNQEIFDKFKSIAATESSMFSLFAPNLDKKWNAKKFSLNDLFHKIYFGDIFKGYLLCTPEEASVNRHDDLIDYYSSSMNNTLKYLNSAIYPCSGFAYRGDINNSIFVKYMERNPRESIFSAPDAMLLFQEINGVNKLDINEKIKKEMINSRMFTPTIDSQVFALAQSLNILKDPSMSKNEFESYCKPALLSYWS